MRIANIVLNDFSRDSRVLKISKALADAGHSVQVVALTGPNLPKSEQIGERLRVDRVRIWMPKRSGFGPFKWAELSLKIALKYRRYDVFHCNDIEAFVIGLLAKLLRPGLKLIYDCHEFESERNAKPPWLNASVRVIEKNFIRFAESVIVVSPSIQSAYFNRYGNHGIPAVHLVRNVPHHRSTDTSEHRLRTALGIPLDAFVAIYQGAFTMNRGIETLLEMSPRLEGTSLHLVFMGYGLLEPQVKLAAQNCANVHFHSAVEYGQVLEYTQDADVGLVSVKPTCLSYLYCLPNKLFESIQGGIPVLVNQLPDCVALLRQYGIGDVIENDNAEDWFDALKRASEMSPPWKEQIRKQLFQAQSELNWEQETQSLMAAYESVELSAN